MRFPRITVEADKMGGSLPPWRDRAHARGAGASPRSAGNRQLRIRVRDLERALCPDDAEVKAFERRDG
jgi:hypothetical protein